MTTLTADDLQAVLDNAIPDRPLIAPLVPMRVLREEYEHGNQTFVQQIDWLVEQGYLGIRRARGDGRPAITHLPRPSAPHHLIFPCRRLFLQM